MVFHMLAVLSEFERDQVSERTRFALQHKRACGEKTGGDVPYGYQLEGARLVADAPEQRAITLISELRLAGHSLRQIARELEARGYKTKSGLTRWHPQIVKQILERKAA